MPIPKRLLVKPPPVPLDGSLQKSAKPVNTAAMLYCFSAVMCQTHGWKSDECIKFLPEFIKICDLPAPEWGVWTEAEWLKITGRLGD